MSATYTIRVYWAAPEPVETRAFATLDALGAFTDRLDAMGVRWGE